MLLAAATLLGLGLGLFCNFRVFVMVAVVVSAAFAGLHGAGWLGGLLFAILAFTLLQLGFGLGLGLRAMMGVSRPHVAPARREAEIPPAAGRQEP